MRRRNRREDDRAKHNAPPKPWRREGLQNGLALGESARQQTQPRAPRRNRQQMNIKHFKGRGE
jgi:hypothetical protein